jgi:hypothetical protein
VIGVKDEAELSMMAGALVVELWRLSHVFSVPVDASLLKSSALPVRLAHYVLPRFRAHRDLLPASQSRCYNGEIHKGI